MTDYKGTRAHLGCCSFSATELGETGVGICWPSLTRLSRSSSSSTCSFFVMGKKMPGCEVSFSRRFSTLSASLLMDWMLSVRRMELAGTGLALLERRLAVCGDAPTEVRFTREFILPPVWSERIFNLSRSDPAESDLVQRTDARSITVISPGIRGIEESFQAHREVLVTLITKLELILARLW